MPLHSGAALGPWGPWQGFGSLLAGWLGHQAHLWGEPMAVCTATSICLLLRMGRVTDGVSGGLSSSMGLGKVWEVNLGARMLGPTFLFLSDDREEGERKQNCVWRPCCQLVVSRRNNQVIICAGLQLKTVFFSCHLVKLFFLISRKCGGNYNRIINDRKELFRSIII